MGMEGRRPLQGDVHRSALKEGATQWAATATALPTSSAARKAFLQRRLLEGAAVHVVQLCLMVEHCRPKNFPHVIKFERLARDLSVYIRVPNLRGTGVQAFLQAVSLLKTRLRLAHWH